MSAKDDDGKIRVIDPRAKFHRTLRKEMNTMSAEQQVEFIMGLVLGRPISEEVLAIARGEKQGPCVPLSRKERFRQLEREYLTRTALYWRGWNSGLIHDHLGEHDYWGPVNHWLNNRGQPMWRATRVLEVEASPAFQAAYLAMAKRRKLSEEDVAVFARRRAEMNAELFGSDDPAS